MNYIFTLLKSKRMWVTIVTFALHLLLTKTGWKLSDANSQAIVDDLILAGGTIAMVVTKLFDAAKSNV